MPFTLLLTPAWWLAKWALARGAVDGLKQSRYGSALIAGGIGIVVIGAMTGAVALGVVRHDKRVARETRAACIAEESLKSEQAARQAVERALAERERALAVSQAALVVANKAREAANILMGEKLDEAARAPDADARVFDADDRWLQALRRRSATATAAKTGGR